MTQPDQTMSIKQILDRYARGLPMNAGKVPMYATDDEDGSLDHIEGINMDTLDLSEKQQLVKMAKEKIDTIKQAAQKRKSKELQDKHEQFIREKVKAELEEKAKQQEPPK